MPTYEYECQQCRERVEAVQKFTDAPLTACPHCGGELRKVFSAVGIVFKGSGFYKNDSRKSSSDTRAKSETPAKTETASVSSSASTSTPASTSSGTATSTTSSSTTSSD
ncbi:MAG: FmdB family zinc ribbon protein [Acidimicrobiales bacterium]